MNTYRLMLMRGDGIPVDMEKSIYYIKMAANKGSVNAINNYGLMLSWGNGIQMNIKEADRYYNMAIKTKNKIYEK